MNFHLSPDTQAILLLTAPLIVGRAKSSSNPLTPGEYKRLSGFLREKQRQPADFLGPHAGALTEDQAIVGADRLRALLDRGFLLSQAVEHWQARAIWVLSREDAAYPKVLKERLGRDAPPVLYGCGRAALLERGGLAVVGSRNVGDELVAYAEGIGRLAASAGCAVVSGGARGIDQAAMRGALNADGDAVGVLADSLERMALNRDHRNLLMAHKLVLISPYDPAVGFNVGHAMQRNKLIYALADAALVVSADYEKGGTWAGAVEQLERFRSVPVYVRTGADVGNGLQALGRRGALPWPDPQTTAEFGLTLRAARSGKVELKDREQLLFAEAGSGNRQHGVLRETPQSEVPSPERRRPVPAEVRSLLERMDTAKTEAEVAAELNVSKSQARQWLLCLVQEGVLERTVRPVRYRPNTARKNQPSLFPQ
jgi:predicted Rossmann fold nucleotide-binding protein DprA/Smf involved in DNA uptake